MESRENVLRDKSYKFALRVVKLYKHLAEEKKEYVLSRVSKNLFYRTDFLTPSDIPFLKINRLSD